MAAPKQPARIYKISDADMIAESRTDREHFLEDKPDFTAFDTDFNDPFDTTWLSEIDAAEVVTKHTVISDILTQFTNAVESNMKTCRDKFQVSKYHIEKAFPEQPLVWNEFGYNDYDEARNNQVKMIQFMKEFHETCVKYSAQLGIAGYTQTSIDEILTMKTALDASNLTQETYKDNTPVLTSNRIGILNLPWEKVKKVCKAGKVIYKDDYGKYQRYILPGGEEEPDDGTQPPPPLPPS